VTSRGDLCNWRAGVTEVAPDQVNEHLHQQDVTDFSSATTQYSINAFTKATPPGSTLQAPAALLQPIV
jgi:hypothetical protein